MLIPKLTHSHINLLNRLSIPHITDPLLIQVLWFHAIFLDEKTNHERHRMHLHTFFEVHLVINGSVVYSTSDGRHYELKEGMGILITPQTEHNLHSFSNDFVRISLAFVVDEASDFYTHLKENPLYIFDISPEIIRNINAVLDEATLSTIFSMTLIKHHILDIICAISRAGGIYEYYSSQNIIVVDKRVTSAMLYINDNKNKWLTSNEVANHCSLSVKQLNRLFCASTGQNLHEYIKAIKVKEAEFLLSHTTLTIKEISKQLDFSSVQYFNRFFSKNAGLTPAHFRQLSEK